MEAYYTQLRRDRRGAKHRVAEVVDLLGFFDPSADWHAVEVGLQMLDQADGDVTGVGAELQRLALVPVSSTKNSLFKSVYRRAPAEVVPSRAASRASLLSRRGVRSDGTGVRVFLQGNRAETSCDVAWVGKLIPRFGSRSDQDVDRDRPASRTGAGCRRRVEPA